MQPKQLAREQHTEEAVEARQQPQQHTEEARQEASPKQGMQESRAAMGEYVPERGGSEVGQAGPAR